MERMKRNSIHGAPRVVVPPLLPSERVLRQEFGLSAIFGRISVRTVVVSTNYRLFLIPEDLEPVKRHLEFHIGCILKVEPLQYHDTHGYQIWILCKDGQSTVICCNGVDGEPRRHDILSYFIPLCFPLSYRENDYQQLFAFQNKEKYSIEQKYGEGWTIYDAVTEFTRLGATSKGWRITNINSSYELCDTYPSFLVVPESITDDEICVVAKFRSRGRIPTLCWKHPHKNSVICRSSQPLTGLSGRVCEEDLKLLKAIFASTDFAYILDARPALNALGNTLKGAGTEDIGLLERHARENQKEVKLDFLNIENLHAVRDSFRKTTELYNGSTSDDRFLSNLESGQWLYHISCIMNAASKAVSMVTKKGASVLVHCSDGWDRTPQLVALAQLMIDPFYRSIIGFTILIQKEWISFGHKFATRSCHGVREKKTNTQTAPIFTQWLDCVYQIIRQYPCSFQFSEKLLVFLSEHVYSCRFGNFLFDSEYESNELVIQRAGVKYKTSSIWGYIIENQHIFQNPLFSDDIKSYHASSVLFPNCSVRYLVPWASLFMKNHRLAIQDNVQQRVSEMANKIKELETRLADLEESRSNPTEPTRRKSEPPALEPDFDSNQGFYDGELVTSVGSSPVVPTAIAVKVLTTTSLHLTPLGGSKTKDEEES